MPMLEQGKFYHLYNRGNNGEILFPEPRNYEYFKLLLKRYLTQDCSIYAYVLLKNHFHILIKVNSENASNSIRTVFATYTRSINKQQNRYGSLFQDGLKRKEISDVDTFWNTFGYILNNPVKHKLTERVGSYSFSAYQDIIYKRGELIDLNALCTLAGNYETLVQIIDETVAYYRLKYHYDL